MENLVWGQVLGRKSKPGLWLWASEEGQLQAGASSRARPRRLCAQQGGQHRVHAWCRLATPRAWKVHGLGMPGQGCRELNPSSRRP